MFTSMLLEKDELRLMRCALTRYLDFLIEELPETDFTNQQKDNTGDLLKRVELEIDCLEALEEDQKSFLYGEN